MQRDLLERHPILRILLYLLTIIAVLYAGGMIWSVIIHFGGIILLFFLAWIISFILQPLSIFLEQRRVPRLAAVSLIYFALMAVVAGGIVLALPAIHSEVQLIAGELTVTLASGNTQHLVDEAVRNLHRLGLSVADAQNLVNQVVGRIPALTNTLSNSAVSTTTSLLSTAATLFFDALLIMILSFYMMLDGDRLIESGVQRLPPSWLPDVRLLQRHIDVIFGGFLRAQLIIATIYGVLTWFVLLLTGQSNGLIFAIIAAVMMLIPFIGPFLAVVPPVILVLLQSPTSDLLRNEIIVLIALGVAQQVTLQVVAPRVMSAHVGLHPLLLFAALLVGAEEGGVWGAVFAGPIAAVLVAMLDTFFERFQQASALYPDIGPGTESTTEEAGGEEGTEEGGGARQGSAGAERPGPAAGREGTRRSAAEAGAGEAEVPRPRDPALRS